MLASCNSAGDGDGASASTERTSGAGGTTAAAGTPAQPAAPRQVRLLRLGSFDEPTYLTAPRGDARRFVVERPGRILVVRRGKVLRTPFLDISDLVTTGGESGLLSMAFPPDYARSGCGAAWSRAPFGSERSPVQIWAPRLSARQESAEADSCLAGSSPAAGSHH